MPYSTACLSFAAQGGVKEVVAEVREEPVTVTTAYRVMPGREYEFRSWVTAVLEAADQLPGFIGGGLLASRTAGEAGSEWHVVHRFESEEAALAWEYSATRMKLGGLCQCVRAGDRTLEYTRAQWLV